MGRRALISCLSVLLLAAQPAGAVGSFERALAAALDVRELHGARVGALVVDAADGSVLFERSADRSLVPASNLKILTALAALDSWGPAHRFSTRVLADAPLDTGGGVDVLFLEGGGDPALTSESWWRLAADLRLRGLRSVRRGLVVDDSRFDDVRWSPGWGKVTSRAYYPPVGALTANYGAFAVEVAPGEAPGSPVQVLVDPPIPWLRIVNLARTATRGKRASLKVDRVVTASVEEVRVSGRLPTGSGRKRFYRSVAEPALYAAGVARLQLEANGIRVGSGTRTGAVPEGAHELLAFEGPRLTEIVRLLLKFSNNGIAEMLVKALGAERQGVGSWSGGLSVLRERLEGLGLDGEAFHVVDGSGLSRGNRVTPRLLVQALRLARDSFAWGPELISALPIAARDGTLEKRAQGAEAKARAKTGLLDGVTGLSGYGLLADGRSVVFSLLVNDYRMTDAAAMAAVDAFVAAMVRTPPPPRKAESPVSSGSDS